MKATNDTNQGRLARKSLYPLASSSRSETVVFATLGLVAFATIVIAVVSGSLPTRSGEDQFVKYFRSGQMAADFRTAKALVRYFFQPERKRSEPPC